MLARPCLGPHSASKPLFSFFALDRPYLGLFPFVPTFLSSIFLTPFTILLCGIHTSCMGAPFPAVHARRSLVFLYFNTTLCPCHTVPNPQHSVHVILYLIYNVVSIIHYTKVSETLGVISVDFFAAVHAGRGIMTSLKCA